MVSEERVVFFHYQSPLLQYYLEVWQDFSTNLLKEREDKFNYYIGEDIYFLLKEQYLYVMDEQQMRLENFLLFFKCVYVA